MAASMEYLLLVVLALGGVSSSSPLRLFGRGAIQHRHSHGQPSGYSYQTKYFEQKVHVAEKPYSCLPTTPPFYCVCVVVVCGVALL